MSIELHPWTTCTLGQPPTSKKMACSGFHELGTTPQPRILSKLLENTSARLVTVDQDIIMAGLAPYLK